MGTEEQSALRVLVNAAGGGAGSVIATRFHSDGAQVFACDIDGKGLENLATKCPGLTTIVADAGNEADVKGIFSGIKNDLGGLDVLVNNVGIAGPTAAAEDVSLADWNESIRVNLTSHFLFAREAIPLMKSQKRGLIVNISSGSAKTAPPLRLPYVVTKGAVLSMTTSLARELGPFGIRVNAILPGAIRGDRIERVISAKAESLGIPAGEYQSSLLRYISMQTFVEPDDIAAMICFLAGPGGERISGQLIGVDGNIEWEE